jgi:hypothetical protein
VRNLTRVSIAGSARCGQCHTPAISLMGTNMEHDSTLYVGLDVDKESITVAYALGSGEVELPGKIGTTKTDLIA